MTLLKRHWQLILSLYIAFIFVQSLFFKFSGAAESIYIFQTIEDWLGLSFFEPHMRFVVGSTELVASVTVVLFASYRFFGAALAAGTMAGAIFFHLFSPLGIVVFDDGGLLFANACGVFVVSLTLMWANREQLQMILPKQKATV